jgi:fermentation-respiration switch protein FrsA (DUF1100 family)
MPASSASTGLSTDPAGARLLWVAPSLCAVALLCVLATPRPVHAAPLAASQARSADRSDADLDRERDGGPWDQVVRCFVMVSVGVILGVAALLLFEDRFVFHPTRQPVADWLPEGLGVTACTFRARDGTRLHAWWHPGEGLGDADQRPVVLWFHGNAGNITHRAENLRALVELGLAVFVFDYRGYGRSEGRPSEVGLYLDGEAAHQHLTHELGVAAERIVCFGRSLGAAVALHVALRARPSGLIMESPFESVAAMVRKTPFLRILVPLLRNRFDNVAKVGRLKAPLLIIHGTADETVPLTQGRAVFDAAHEPKAFLPIEGAGHNDVLQVGGRAYCDRIAEFCRDCVTRRQEVGRA